MEEELPILTVVFASGFETRKIVERAKGVMQRDLKISEEEAYLTLQRESRQRRKSMREVAEAILLNDEIRHPRA
jgi:uroporphyrinogen-III synthase